MQELLSICAARRRWGKPYHPDPDAGSEGDRKSYANQQVVRVTALLQCVEAAVSLVCGERFREAGLIAGERQFREIHQVSTVGDGKIDEFAMLRQIGRNVTRNWPELSRANPHRAILPYRSMHRCLIHHVPAERKFTPPGMVFPQKNREIRFRSAATILETFGLPKDGRYYKRLIAGFERIFYSTFYSASDDQTAEAIMITRTSFRFVKDLQLWYLREPASDQDSRRHENVIVLSEEFWREIHEQPIPVDLDVVRALADSPGNLDLYVWLVWRCWSAKGLATVPRFGSEGLISQLGISENLRERDFRRQIVQWLKVIHQLWPGCPASLAESGACLLLKPDRSSPKFSTAQREFDPGVHVTQFAPNT